MGGSFNDATFNGWMKAIPPSVELHSLEEAAHRKRKNLRESKEQQPGRIASGTG
jgi:hypothetical protein